MRRYGWLLNPDMPQPGWWCPVCGVVLRQPRRVAGGRYHSGNCGEAMRAVSVTVEPPTLPRAEPTVVTPGCPTVCRAGSAVGDCLIASLRQHVDTLTRELEGR